MVIYRKTRFVCVSDTHGYTPQQAGFHMPPGDVLIHAGDLTNRGSKAELQRTMQWIRDAAYEVKIVVAGNHDVALDAPFYAEHGVHFHDKKMESPEECMNVVTSSLSVIFLNHESRLVRLTRPSGPHTTFKIFGSPYSRFRGRWAFGYDSAEEAENLWHKIPMDVDIVVTHSPPSPYCDGRRGSDEEGKSFGCDYLHQKLSQVRPMLAVCGHVHEGRGYERVRWDETDDDYGSSILGDPQDPLPPMGSKKQSVIDLTGRQRKRLENASQSYPTNISSSLHGMNEENARQVDSARKETCVVNAAILATSWPHKGGKKFHSPIIVDLDLPTWENEKQDDGGFQSGQT